MIGADTNVILRYFLWDDPAQSPVAGRFIDDDCTPDQPAALNLIVLAEAVSYLEQKRRAPKKEILRFLDLLFQNPNIRMDREELTLSAIDLYENSRSGFTDCLIFCANRDAGASQTFTFDKSAASAGMMTLLE